MQTAVTPFPTTDHAATRPQEDIEMLKAQHLTNALKFIGNAMRGGPSIKDGPQKRHGAASVNEMHTDVAAAIDGNAPATRRLYAQSVATEPRVVPMNDLGNIDDPNDLPSPGDVTAAEDVIDPRSAPLVSLGQGEYARDIFLDKPKATARTASDLAMSAVYIQCAKMARLPQEVLNVTDIQAALSLRVVGTISKPLAAYLNEPAEPAAFSCHKVYLGRALHEQILMDFAKKLHARGVEPGRVLFMVETLNAALSPVHMDAIDDEELASISDAALAARGLPNR